MKNNTGGAGIDTLVYGTNINMPLVPPQPVLHYVQHDIPVKAPTLSSFGGNINLKKYNKNIDNILKKLSKKYSNNLKTNIRQVIKNELKK